ncbi:hypothetical protein [Prochlorococcus marinus]|uniref:hypothetical protein n=1 Tax=Prochlorococcus marinus TaxID=1219 RepID=UPI0022B3A865|nr:hypothetical protein [Prochlorococcus marinus]
MYSIELALKMSPIPLSVQRKELRDASALYNSIKQSLQTGVPKVLEIDCEKLKDKKIAILLSEVLAVQIYEKTAGIGGNRRPGFSLDQ